MRRPLFSNREVLVFAGEAPDQPLGRPVHSESMLARNLLNFLIETRLVQLKAFQTDLAQRYAPAVVREVAKTDYMHPNCGFKLGVV